MPATALPGGCAIPAAAVYGQHMGMVRCSLHLLAICDGHNPPLPALCSAPHRLVCNPLSASPANGNPGLSSLDVAKTVCSRRSRHVLAHHVVLLQVQVKRGS